MNMQGFAQFNPTKELVDQLKLEWTMYSCNGWIGIHKTTGKKIKCGTYYSLLQMCDHQSRSYNTYPNNLMFTE